MRLVGSSALIGLTTLFGFGFGIGIGIDQNRRRRQNIYGTHTQFTFLRINMGARARERLILLSFTSFEINVSFDRLRHGDGTLTRATHEFVTR